MYLAHISSHNVVIIQGGKGTRDEANPLEFLESRSATAMPMRDLGGRICICYVCVPYLDLSKCYTYDSFSLRSYYYFPNFATSGGP